MALFAGWAIVWGVIYGEYLGDLGRRLLSLEPIWIDREEALVPLLLFSLAIGVGHVVLGIVLGIWCSARAGRHRELTERAALLVAMIGLFAVTGIATGLVPEGVMTPAVAAVVVGMVIMMWSGGAMGLLMGPLELLGTIGNVLSYLRIAAIGLASVYLARVANELGAAAPLLIGIVVATLFHTLNLALGAFSPTIQSLRLHYVEFFGKFYESGGEEFNPFGATDVITGP
jgi:V/A-type H+/Na+-transporting ATPase subunit I